MTPVEQSIADIWTTGVSPDSYPTLFSRGELDAQNVLTASEVRRVPDGQRVLAAGAVTHRQRPETASGTVFINLEDETGLVNVICSAGVWARFGRVAQSAPALIVRGIVESAEGVSNLIADKITAFHLLAPSESRDFR
jgi:error-prone DNA polymerase